jgi:hypothetical protein
MSRCTLIRGLVGLALALGIAAPAHAAGGPQTLSVTPAIFEQTVERGSATTHQVIVTNNGSEPLFIRAQPAAFELHEDIASEYKQIYDTSAWITIPQPEFTLRASERRTVSFTVTVPVQAEPGGHYATIYFESLIPDAAPGHQVITAAPRVGTLAFLTVQGNIIERAEIAGFSVPRLHEGGNVPIELKLRNTGNLHLLPTGRVKVTDGRGRVVTTLTIDPGFTMPKTTRTYGLTWSGAQLFHRYFIQAEVRYGSQGDTIASRPLELWVAPWTLMAFVLLPLAAIVVALYFTRRRWLSFWQAFRGRPDTKS